MNPVSIPEINTPKQVAKINDLKSSTFTSKSKYGAQPYLTLPNVNMNSIILNIIRNKNSQTIGNKNCNAATIGNEKIHLTTSITTL